MRRPSWLAYLLAALYLTPAFLLDLLIVTGLEQSYGEFDTAAMAFVSAPVGLIVVPELDSDIPLSNRVAWASILVGCQLANVLLTWLFFRGVKWCWRKGIAPR